MTGIQQLARPRSMAVGVAFLIIGMVQGCGGDSGSERIDGGKSGSSDDAGSPEQRDTDAEGPSGEPLEGAIRVAVVNSRACAVLEDGHVWCWGADPKGRNPSFRAQEVPGLEGVTELSMAGNAACAVLSGGGLVCWGNDLRLDFANNAAELPTPTVLEGASDVVWVRLTSAPNGYKACVLDRDDRLICWRPDGSFPREPVLCGLEIEELPSVGIALKKSGSAVAFHEGVNGECEIDNLPELEGASALSRGTGAIGAGVCGILDGQVLCASNIISSSEDIIELAPIELPRPAIALDKSAGDRRCALLEGQELWCWAGTALSAARMGAPRLELSGDIVDFSVSGGGGCAVLADTTVKCWGLNSEGQRGSDAASNDPPSLVLR